MNNKVFDADNLYVNAEEGQRLSYEMLFKENGYENGNGHTKTTVEEVEDDQKKSSSKEHEQEIEQLNEKWQRALEKAKEEAYRQGLEEGEEKGKEMAVDSMNQQFSAVDEAISSVDLKIATLLDDLKPHVATMAFDVAEKIIGLPIKSKKLKRIMATEVRQVLSSIEQDIQVKITLAATDYGFFVRAMKDLPNGGNIKISSSDTLNTGEYSIDTRNERIVKNFKKMLKDFRQKVALEDKAELEVEE